jgi:hypothetical protein
MVQLALKVQPIHQFTMKHFWIFFCTALLIGACSTASNSEPKSVFTGQLAKKHVSLKVLLSNEFTVEDLTTGEQHTYLVSYDERLHENTIVDKATNAELWKGEVFRAQNTWLLTTRLTDSTYWISALKIEDNMMLGFNAIKEQMLAIDVMVANGKANSLKLTDNPESHTLRADERALPGLYGQVLKSLPARYRVIAIGRQQSGEPTSMKEPFKSVMISDAGMLKVELIDAGTRALKLDDASGKNIFLSRIDSSYNEYDINHVTRGVVRLSVLDGNTSEVLAVTDLNFGS